MNLGEKLTLRAQRVREDEATSEVTLNEKLRKHFEKGVKNLKEAVLTDYEERLEKLATDIADKGETEGNINWMYENHANISRFVALDLETISENDFTPTEQSFFADDKDAASVIEYALLQDINREYQDDDASASLIDLVRKGLRIKRHTNTEGPQIEVSIEIEIRHLSEGLEDVSILDTGKVAQERIISPLLQEKEDEMGVSIVWRAVLSYYGHLHYEPFIVFG